MSRLEIPQIAPLCVLRQLFVRLVTHFDNLLLHRVSFAIPKDCVNNMISGQSLSGKINSNASSGICVLRKEDRSHGCLHLRERCERLFS
jgi:hypothetical protein